MVFPGFRYSIEHAGLQVLNNLQNSIFIQILYILEWNCLVNNYINKYSESKVRLNLTKVAYFLRPILEKSILQTSSHVI